MFDVAAGEAELVEFLLTRFDSLDLKTRINIDAAARVVEQLAPVKAVEVPPPVVEAEGAPVVSLEVELPSSLDEVQRVPEPHQEEPALAAASAAPEAQPADMLSLIQGFYQAAERYKTEVATEPPESPDEEA